MRILWGLTGWRLWLCELGDGPAVETVGGAVEGLAGANEAEGLAEGGEGGFDVVLVFEDGQDEVVFETVRSDRAEALAGFQGVEGEVGDGIGIHVAGADAVAEGDGLVVGRDGDGLGEVRPETGVGPVFVFWSQEWAVALGLFGEAEFEAAE